MGAPAYSAGSVRDLEARLPVPLGGRRTQRQSQRPRRAPLLADHVAEIVGIHCELEQGILAGLDDVDPDLVGTIDDAARHEGHQVAQLPVDLVRLVAHARDARLGSAYDFVDRGGLASIGTDDSRIPIHRKRANHRAHSRSAGVA